MTPEVQELSFYHRCGLATNGDELHSLAAAEGLRPVLARWEFGRLVEVKFTSAYSGRPSVHYTYDR